MPVLNEAGIWPVLFGVIIGTIATVLIVWVRGRIARKGRLAQDLLCEPGQVSGPALPGMLGKVFRMPAAEFDFGAQAGASTLTLVCQLEPERHRSGPLEIVGWSSEAIVLRYPGRGPCIEPHPEAMWTYRIETSLDGDSTTHATGSILLCHPEGQGYPRFPSVPGIRVVDLRQPETAAR